MDCNFCKSIKTVHLYQINLEEAVYMCNNKQCNDILHQTQYVKRNFMDMAKVKGRKKVPTELDALLEPIGTEDSLNREIDDLLKSLSGNSPDGVPSVESLKENITMPVQDGFTQDLSSCLDFLASEINLEKQECPKTEPKKRPVVKVRGRPAKSSSQQKSSSNSLLLTKTLPTKPLMVVSSPPSTKDSLKASYQGYVAKSVITKKKNGTQRACLRKPKTVELDSDYSRPSSSNSSNASDADSSICSKALVRKRPAETRTRSPRIKRKALANIAEEKPSLAVKETAGQRFVKELKNTCIFFTNMLPQHN